MESQTKTLLRLRGPCGLKTLMRTIPSGSFAWASLQGGRLLELVVLVFDSGDELIIHSMKARPEAADLLP